MLIKRIVSYHINAPFSTFYPSNVTKIEAKQQTLYFLNHSNSDSTGVCNQPNPDQSASS